MAHDPGAIEAALSAATGEDAALVLELRGAFLASARTHVATLETAPSAPAWQHTALRLKGLAASFGALDLMRAADAASLAEARDPTALRRIHRLMAALAR